MKTKSLVIFFIAAFVLVTIFPLNAIGKTKTFPVGAFLAMTGSGAHIGRVMSQGAITAVDQLNAGGGVEGYNFKLIITDFKNVDVNLAVTGVRKMISIDKIPAVLA